MSENFLLFSPLVAHVLTVETDPTYSTTLPSKPSSIEAPIPTSHELASTAPPIVTPSTKHSTPAVDTASPKLSSSVNGIPAPVDNAKTVTDPSDKNLIMADAGVNHLPGANGVLPQSPSSDRALEAALQEQVRTEAESHEQSEDDVDMEDSYAPDPAQLAPVSVTNSVVEGPGSTVLESAADLNGGTAETDELPIVENVPMDIDDEDDDDYEPPEATPPVEVPSPVESPPFSPAPPESVSEFERFSTGRGGMEDVENATTEDVRVNSSGPAEV